MPKIKYVGRKPDGETAFSLLPGAPSVWMPGDSNEVSDELAARMLAHPDVFALDDGADVPQDAEVGSTNDEGAEPDVLEVLGKDELRALAAEIGVVVHHAAGKAKLIEAIRAAKKPTE